MKKILLSILAMSAVIACSPNAEIETEQTKPEDFPRFTARTESGTKAFIDGYEVKWNADDELTVYSAAQNKFGYYKADQASEGNTSATFDFVSVESYGNSQPQLNQNVAIFPRQQQTVIQDNGSSVTASVVIPATQPIGSDIVYNSTTFPMIAVTESMDDHNLHFKNICSVIVFQVRAGQGEYYNIDRVVFKGNNDETLSGTAEVTVSASQFPEITGWTNGNKSIVLRDQYGISISEWGPTWIYVTVPPTDFQNGFTLSIYDDNGQMMEKSITRAVSIGRGESIDTPEFIYDPVHDPEAGAYAALYLAYDESSNIQSWYDVNFAAGTATLLGNSLGSINEESISFGEPLSPATPTKAGQDFIPFTNDEWIQTMMDSMSYLGFYSTSLTNQTGYYIYIDSNGSLATSLSPQNGLFFIATRAGILALNTIIGNLSLSEKKYYAASYIGNLSTGDQENDCIGLDVNSSTQPARGVMYTEPHDGYTGLSYGKDQYTQIRRFYKNNPDCAYSLADLYFKHHETLPLEPSIDANGNFNGWRTTSWGQFITMKLAGEGFYFVGDSDGNIINPDSDPNLVYGFFIAPDPGFEPFNKVDGMCIYRISTVNSNSEEIGFSLGHSQSGTNGYTCDLEAVTLTRNSSNRYENAGRSLWNFRDHNGDGLPELHALGNYTYEIEIEGNKFKFIYGSSRSVILYDRNNNEIPQSTYNEANAVLPTFSAKISISLDNGTYFIRYDESRNAWVATTDINEATLLNIAPYEWTEYEENFYED